MKSYQPADQGGYKEGASSYDTYHCWAAAQYREKVFPIRLLHLSRYQRVLTLLLSSLIQCWLERIGHLPHLPRLSKQVLGQRPRHHLRKDYANPVRPLGR